MCGVAGIWQPEMSAADLYQGLERMAGRLRHRGPDDQGIYCDPDIGLAHRRLSIIDIAGGHQPMEAIGMGLVVSFNGEIFNYLELREELSEAGWLFRTRSDTEVLLAAYHVWGDAFLQYLNGQFALALWDKRRRRLLLARDHAGIQPLFIAHQGRSVLFASEVKALVPMLRHALEPDLAALDQLFTFWVPLPPATGFMGIRQLLPGEYLVLDEFGEHHQRWFHWDFPVRGDECNDDSEQLAGELRELLEDSVRLRLRADVPVGCYLSGGLDSSATTALAAKLGPAPATFSINFAGTDVDEAAWQERLYRHLGVRHESLQAHSKQIAQALPRAVWHGEKPLLRTAPAPMLLLSGKVAELGHKVVLTGEGADEVFAGYDLFKELKVRQFWARQPESAWRGELLRRLYPWMDLGSLTYLKRFFGDQLQEADLPWFAHLPRWRNTGQCKRFYSEAMSRQLAENPVAALESWLPRESRTWAPLHQAQYLEVSLLMDGYLLSSQGDRMLMANGVEGRFPFLDPRLVRFANRIAPSRKLPGLNEKALLRKAVADLLPSEILNRPKQPYRAPDGEILVQADYVRELLTPARLRSAGYFDPARVDLLWRKARAGRLHANRDQMALTGIITTQLWHEQFIEGNSAFASVAA